MLRTAFILEGVVDLLKHERDGALEKARKFPSTCSHIYI